MELLRENSYLVVYFPATNSALVFRVVSVFNRGFERIDYGPLPIRAGETLPTYDGGTATVPADGVMPGMSYTPSGISFPLSGAFDETDMWFVPSDWRDRLFHVHTYLKPWWLRVEVDIPKDVYQYRFQRNKLVLGIDRAWGWSRGHVETVHLPGVHYGYRFGNDCNLSVYTKVTFVYGEYLVEIPRDPSLIFDILIRRVSSYWVTLPVTVMDPSLAEALRKTYGIQGFQLYPADKRSEAVSRYNELLREVRA